ncbi:DUF2382 domain-containing protein [Chamaesiphon minutus]|uniref:DUF2382 domain-containing protein n=1 Tax=Chamaesiphon minutus (strain ATCC 27169 / PCC 6605) TaxID=1173020 RepID=K9UGH9_CHAP6|nr:DUF2382 domain-containing protein [Chamaesiphon minutus]AFY93541.1 hypothetical protein Cha6605_2486 [Chamaesiphon minutus PCC 6605]
MIYDRSKDSQQQPDLVQLQKNATDSTRILTEETIYLLEERLMVDLTRHKTGEIVVRKEIDTQVLHVEVPVRREKLIVEQVSPEYKLIAQIDLGSEQLDRGAISYVNHDDSIVINGNSKSLPIDNNHSTTVGGTVTSPQSAIDILAEIVRMAEEDCETVRIEISLKNNRNRDTYQRLFAGDRSIN